MLQPGKENLRQRPFLRHEIDIAGRMRNIPENRFRLLLPGRIAGIEFPLVICHEIQGIVHADFACLRTYRPVIGQLPGIIRKPFGYIFRKNTAYFVQGHSAHCSRVHKGI